MRRLVRLVYCTSLSGDYVSGGLLLPPPLVGNIGIMNITRYKNRGFQIKTRRGIRLIIPIRPCIIKNEVV